MRVRVCVVRARVGTDAGALAREFDRMCACVRVCAYMYVCVCAYEYVRACVRACTHLDGAAVVEAALDVRPTCDATDALAGSTREFSKLGILGSTGGTGGTNGYCGALGAAWATRSTRSMRTDVRRRLGLAETVEAVECGRAPRQSPAPMRAGVSPSSPGADVGAG